MRVDIPWKLRGECSSCPWKTLNSHRLYSAGGILAGWHRLNLSAETQFFLSPYLLILLPMSPWILQYALESYSISKPFVNSKNGQSGLVGGRGAKSISQRFGSWYGPRYRAYFDLEYLWKIFIVIKNCVVRGGGREQTRTLSIPFEGYLFNWFPVLFV